MFSDEELKEMLEVAKSKKASAQVNVGDLCWFRNKNYDETDISGASFPFFVGQVVSIDEEAEMVNLKASTEKFGWNEGEYFRGTFTIKKQFIMEYSEIAEQGIPDMMDLNELNHSTLLYNLRQRYLRNEIFTFVGPTLLIINPFKPLRHLLTDEVAKEYFSIITWENMLQRKKELAPHIFSVAATAYRQLRENKEKQAIVISGESGAGKTESAKIAMKFLTALSGISEHSEERKAEEGEISIEQKILNWNPVLEAFGNAKTVRNNNSSRFGKYVKLIFNLKKGDILGAETLNYLLEKSRIWKQASQERNYHIFYHLLKGATIEKLQELYLTKGDKRPTHNDFAYMKEGTDIADTKILNDKELFDELVAVFNDLGFKEEEQNSIWRIVAAWLKIGEIKFSDDKFDESGTPWEIVNQDILDEVSQLLGISSAAALEKEIVNKPPTPGVDIRSPLIIDQWYESRDSLAKDLYNKLFWWLVKRMNLTILPKFILEGNSSDAENTKTIGLLDIFGFERFKENYFEQLLINYTNEKLHKLYISAVFDAEKMELSNEGLGYFLHNLKYPDNTGVEVIKLLDEVKRIGANDTMNGILTFVNDWSKQQPRPTFENLMDAVIKDHGKNPKLSYDFSKDKKRDKFTIIHSAKEVKYDIKTFIIKNVDSISSSLEGIVAKEAEQQVGWIYTQYVPEISKDDSDESPVTKKATLKTIWSKFSVQMRNLMLELAEPLLDLGQGDSGKGKKAPPWDVWELHFLRCIKPNEQKIADCFVDSMTLLQMTYMGVLESIEVKQKNFPYRRKFAEFYQRYEDLCSLSGSKRFATLVSENADFKNLSEMIITETFRDLAEGLFAFGYNKIFCKNELVLVLEKARIKAREKKSKAVDLVNKCFKIQLAKTIHKDKLIKIKRIQRFWRKRGEIIIDSRAKEFCEKAKSAVLKYKMIVDKERMEREARDRIVRLLKSNVKKQKIMRYAIALKNINFIVMNAWLQIRETREKSCSVTVQRLFRGFLEKQKFQTAINNAYEVRLAWVSTKALRIIQKTFRGVLVRNRLRTLHVAAAYIQGHMRMRWLSTLFQKLRYEVRKIQRVVRKFLIRKKMVRERLIEFFGKEINLLENVRNVENFAMFGDGSTNIERTSFFQNHTPYNLKKISLFCQVIDIQIKFDTSDIYETPWSLHWHQLSKEQLINDAPIQRITLGSTHTLAVNNRSKLYSWGWNDSGQLGHNPSEVIKKEIKPGSHAMRHLALPDYSAIPEWNFSKIKQIVSGENHNLIRDDNGNVYAFGNNQKGQLGMGNYEDLFMPARIDALPENNIKEIAAWGDQNLSWTFDGEVYIWPWVKDGQKISIPQSIIFGNDKIKICNVSWGYNFGILLSNQGLVFSFGKSNSDGQLGHGGKENYFINQFLDKT